MTAPPTQASPRETGAKPPPAFLHWLHQLDRILGLLEHAVLAGLLLLLVGIGAYQAIGRNVFDSSPLWSYELLSYLVFFIALMGAALSAHTGQIISMDVVTRALPPRGRAIARIATGVFTIAVCALLVYASLRLRREALMDEHDYHIISSANGVLMLPIGASLIAYHVLVRLLGFVTALARGDAIPDEQQSLHQDQRMLTLLIIAVLVMLAIGAPIFAVMIAATVVGVASLPRGLFVEFGGPISDILKLGSGEQAAILSTIPLFIFAGYLMAESKTADRVVNFAQALLGWLPGGLAIVTIFACAIFTVFTGASGVTIVALGGLLLPALLREGYPQRFSLGLVAGTGSVGLLFPPALPLFIYGTVYGMAAQTATDTGSGEMELITFSTDRFLVAGIVPGMVLCGVLCVYAVSVAIARNVPRQTFNARALARSFFVAIPEISIPFVIVSTLVTGLLTISEAAALTALYVLVIEAFLFRDLELRSLWRLVREAMALVGGIFIIILCAAALTNYFVTAGVPNMLVDWITSHIESKWAFLLALNVLLLFVGMLMDVFSAIVVVVPLITPTALRYGVDPYHLGVVFLLNLELGYLTPPVGLNLFITSFKFNQPIIAVVRATLPFMFAMIVVLGVVTYVPALTVVPPPKRTGRVGQLVAVVETERGRIGLVNEIPLPDGTKLTIADCDAIPDTIAKLDCTGLFASYSKCDDDACRTQAVAAYLAERDGGDKDDDGWGDDDWGDDEAAADGDREAE